MRWGVILLVFAIPLLRVDVRIETILVLILAIAFTIARLLLELVRHEVHTCASMDHSAVVGLQWPSDAAVKMGRSPLAFLINMMEQKLLELEQLCDGDGHWSVHDAPLNC